MYKKKRNVPYGCDGKRLLFGMILYLYNIQTDNQEDHHHQHWRGGTLIRVEQKGWVQAITNGGTKKKKIVVVVALSEKNSHNNNWLSLSSFSVWGERINAYTYIYIYINIQESI